MTPTDSPASAVTEKREVAASKPLESVVLRRTPGTTEFEEFGLLMGDSGLTSTWRVLRPDGSTAEVKREPGVIALRHRGVLHAMRVHTDELRSLFASHSDEIVEQLVCDYGPRGVSGTEVIRLLTGIELDRKAVTAAWTRVRNRMIDDEAFTRSGEKFIKVNVSPSDLVIHRWINFLGYPVSIDSDDDGASPSPAQEEVDTSSQQPEATRLRVANASGRAASTSAPLIVALAELGTHVQSLDDVLRQLLPIATYLASTAGLPEPPSGLSQSEARLWRLVRQATPQLERRREQLQLGKSGVEQVAGAVCDQLRAGDAKFRSKHAASAWAVLDGLLLSETTRIPLIVVVKVIAGTAGLARPAPYSGVLVELTALVASSFDGAKSHRAIEDFVNSDVAAQFATALADLPLTGGPRARIISAIHAHRADVLVAESWWCGFGSRELSDVLDGALRSVVTSEPVLTAIALPRARELARTCKSRRQLGVLLGLPGEVARLLDAAELTRAFESVARRDALATQWVRDLRSTQTLDALRDDNKSLVAELAKTAGEIDRLTGELAGLTAQREELLASARASRLADAAQSEEHDRRVRLKTLRSLAELAAAVATSPATPDIALSQRIATILNSENLAQSGTVNEAVPYDPAIHDAQGQLLEIGQSVTVVCPGYNLREGARTRPLLKARVTG